MFEKLDIYKTLTIIAIVAALYLILRGVKLNLSLSKNPAATGPAQCNLKLTSAVQIQGLPGCNQFCQIPLASDYLCCKCQIVPAVCQSGTPAPRVPANGAPQPVIATSCACAGIGSNCNAQSVSPFAIHRREIVQTTLRIICTCQLIAQGGGLTCCAINNV